jgi:predicted dithiol-disulfide oxidoreductase (DUF899 family)
MARRISTRPGKEHRMTLPPIVTAEEWNTRRASLLTKEQELTQAIDTIAAERRRLPMVKIDKTYEFDGPNGKVSLVDIFEGRKQLIVQHFMFHPSWEEGCVYCSSITDGFGHPDALHARDVTLAMVSRAPIASLMAYKRKMGWTFPWYSSFRSDFNQDLGMTIDDSELGEISVFLRDGDDVFHTYTTDDRGIDHLGSTLGLLDITPYGRQESWEDSPEGFPKIPDDSIVRRRT